MSGIRSLSPGFGPYCETSGPQYTCRVAFRKSWVVHSGGTEQKEKRAGVTSRSLFGLGHCGGEFSGAIVPTRNGRGDIVGIEPLVNLLPARLGKCGLHPAHDLVHDIRVDVLEVVLRKTARHRVDKTQP
jgi:hypothetical protein